MTTRDPRGAEPAGVSVFLSTVVGCVTFAAVAILGMGMLSFFADRDIISVEGLSMWPGMIGMLIAIVLFAFVLTVQLRRGRASFSSVVIATMVAVIGHLVGVWVAAMAEDAGYGHAGAAVGQLVTGGTSLILVAAGMLGGWLAIALRRSPSGTPQWPWERHGT